MNWRFQIKREPGVTAAPQCDTITALNPSAIFEKD
jgi:hypothetical protein